MKRLFALILILSMTLALMSFTPLVMAEEPSGEVKPHDYYLDSKVLNEPIFDGIDYHINIKAPKMFASFDKVLVVEQGEDILVKIDRKVERIHVAHSVDPSLKPHLNSITIESTGKNEGYIFLHYNIDLTTFETVVYSYQERFLADPAPWVTLVGDFSEYLAKKGTTVTSSDIEAINASISNITYANNAIYIIANATQSIFKIAGSSMTEIAIDNANSWKITHAKLFTVSQDEDIFIYVKDSANTPGEILKMKNGAGKFEKIAEMDDVVGMESLGGYLYLLKTNSLMKIKNGDFTTNLLAPIPEIKENGICNSFDVSLVGDTVYVSLAIDGNDNILTYKDVADGEGFKLEFANHYGANCACDTPHQGWLNSPSEIAVTEDETTVYVVDKNNKKQDRLVIMNAVKDNDKTRYVEYFFDNTRLNMESIDEIAVDKDETLYIASADKLYLYKNTKEYDKPTSPLSRKDEIAGFDGNITNLKVVGNEAITIYLSTDKNSIYKIDGASRKLEKIGTLSNSVKAIAPSQDKTRIYVVTDKNISSYNIGAFDATSPITSLNTVESVEEIAVDFAGNIYAIMGNNRIYKYKRIEDNSYKLYYSYNRISTGYEDIASFVILPRNGAMYVVDTALHIAEKIRSPKAIGYITDVDKGHVNVSHSEDALFVAKVNKDTRVYTSRVVEGNAYAVNFEMYRDANAGAYFYVLDKAKDNANMYVVVDSNNKYGYIKANDLVRVNATTDTAIGTVFTPLFSETTIYRYPYEDAPIVMTTTGTMTFVDNVAYENGTNVWQNATTKWFKVKFTTPEDAELTGYVKMNEITKSAAVDAPATKIHLRVTTKAGEVARLYDMPDLASGIILDNIINGTLVRLMQDEFDPDSEFTRVEIKTKDGEVLVGYMLTANLQENKFTTLQVVAIIVSVITALITILVIILIVQYRKKKNNENTFKALKEEIKKDKDDPDRI